MISNYEVHFNPLILRCLRRGHKKVVFAQKRFITKRFDFRASAWKNFGECSIRMRWGSQNL